MERLFVYGSLGPGQPNEHVLSKIGGTWQKGYVLGNLFEDGWGAKLGHPGIRLSADGEQVDGHLFSSENLENSWKELDEFEGEEYLRVKATGILKDTAAEVEAFIYVLR